MRRKFLFIGVIMSLLCIFNAYPQDGCDHPDMIMSFLHKLSSAKYVPTLHDYNVYFDSHSEIEAGLRDKYIRNNYGQNLTDDENSKSFTLELLLTHCTVKQLVGQATTKGCNWLIIDQYAKVSATIVYEVSVEGSQDLIKIQMINWSNKNRCGIVDILDANNQSILIHAK